MLRYFGKRAVVTFLYRRLEKNPINYKIFLLHLWASGETVERLKKIQDKVKAKSGLLNIYCKEVLTSKTVYILNLILHRPKFYRPKKTEILALQSLK